MMAETKCLSGEFPYSKNIYLQNLTDDWQYAWARWAHFVSPLDLSKTLTPTQARGGSNFDIQMLPALKLTKMRCLACFEGTCEVTNLSKKYEDILNSVNANLLLPDTELNILQALQTENRTMVAAEIASELDCSGQLIGRRGRKLSERNLVERHHNGQVYSYILTEEAKNAYFGDNDERDLNLDE